MANLIDTSVWIDFTRSKSSWVLKNFIAPYILDTNAFLSEPVIFEVMRHASAEEFKPLEAMTATFPVLSTPSDLWKRATSLGRTLRDKGYVVGSIDLVIAALASYHGAQIITFDQDFQKIALCEKTVKVNLLKRPS